MCVSCARTGEWLCQTCEKNIAEYPETCISCGEKTLHGKTCAICQKNSSLAGAIAVGKYQDPILRSAVHTLKFGGVKDLAEPLGILLARKISAALGTTLTTFTIVPLPLHPRKERLRGFNQSDLLAKSVGVKLSLSVKHVLRRVRSSPPQTTIDSNVPDLRKLNVTGAFAIQSHNDATHEPAVPSNILLVDDVATTGATLEEAARVLYHHGATEVWGAVVCRG